MNKKEYQRQKSHDPRLTTKNEHEPEQSKLILNFYSGEMNSTTIVSLTSSPSMKDERMTEHFDLSDSQCCN